MSYDAGYTLDTDASSVYLHAMAIEEWRYNGAGYKELMAHCYSCRRWVPIVQAVRWQNPLAMTWCYTCLDCMAVPEREARMRAYGWNRWA